MAPATRAPAVEARDAYVSDFEAFEREVNGRDPPWLRASRRAAITRFGELGFPTIKDEEWKYTNLAPIVKTRFRAAGMRQTNGVARETLEPFTFPGLTGTQIVFVNGRHVPQLSVVQPSAEGIRVASLADVLETEPQSLETGLAGFPTDTGRPFAALNAAFMFDGAYVDVPRGQVVTDPIHLVFASTSPKEPTISHPRTVIALGDESQATVIESYFGLGPDVYFTNAVTDVTVGEGAVLDHYKVQRESAQAFHVASLRIRPGRNSSVSQNSLSFGGALVRNDVNAVFDAEGAELNLNGLYAVTGTQHVDNHTKIDHATARCTSRELYKGILDEKSRGVFNGQVYVRKDAQKTNAGQRNKNLLLSKDALVHSTPGLEINADDVKCTHGSSIGQLEEDAIFYLRSRGIEEVTVRGLLTFAFAKDILRLINVEPVRTNLEALLLSRLPNADAIREAL